MESQLGQLQTSLFDIAQVSNLWMNALLYGWIITLFMFSLADAVEDVLFFWNSSLVGTVNRIACKFNWMSELTLFIKKNYCLTHNYYWILFFQIVIDDADKQDLEDVVDQQTGSMIMNTSASVFVTPSSRSFRTMR